MVQKVAAPSGARKAPEAFCFSGMDRDAFKGGEDPEIVPSLLAPLGMAALPGQGLRRGAVQPAQATAHPRSCLLEVLNRASRTAAAICATRGPTTAPAWAILAWIVAVDSCTWYRSGSTLRSTHNNNGYCVNTATPRPPGSPSHR
jgi:hypothetical protein